ncbi:MAG: peptidase MA family metallohydrolase [Chloroflexi bacterium]|nr:peptidase MA family metallohydrolase [Chloroflexota bacterium]
MTQRSRSRAVRGALGLRLAAVAFVGALALMLVAPGISHAAPQASGVAVETPDPTSLTFKVRVTGDADIASAVVNYKVLSPDGNVGGSLRAEVAGGRAADISATLQTISAERYIPTGTQITYSWAVTDKNGATTNTPEATMTFLDGRYQWQSKKEGRVTVYWYGGNDANGQLALTSTAEGLATTEALLNVKLQYDVRVVVWRNSADAKAAQRPRAATFDQQVITGGSRVSADVLHIYDPLGGFGDVARHEAAHIVTKVAGDGPFSQVPSWIDEGTAVYAQKDPGGYKPAVERAIKADGLARLRNMAAPTNQPGQVDVFYGQSWSTVKFMVDTYGKDKFAGVFKTVKEGAAMDEALEKNIGVDQDGLYNAWRKSVGLATIDFPPVPRAPSIAGAQATQPPLGIPTSVTSAENTSGAVGAVSSAPSAAVSPTTAITVGGGAVVVAAVLGFLALRLSRRKA